MAITFELTAENAVCDAEEFCKLKEELTYIGQFANKETSEIIPGTIIQYDGKFYTNDLPGIPGMSSSPADADGLVKSTLKLFEADYVPENCKSVNNCPIVINVWNTIIDDECPIARYAFDATQMDEAKEIAAKNDVDIFFNGEEIAKEDFLNFE